jgi:hypothetical protein
MQHTSFSENFAPDDIARARNARASSPSHNACPIPHSRVHTQQKTKSIITHISHTHISPIVLTRGAPARTRSPDRTRTFRTCGKNARPISKAHVQLLRASPVTHRRPHPGTTARASHPPTHSRQRTRARRRRRARARPPHRQPRVVVF